MRWVSLAVAVYLTGALFTFGWLYNRPRECPYRSPGMCKLDRDGLAATKGALWPLYLAAELAIKATKP